MIPLALVESLKGVEGFDESFFLSEHAVGNPPTSIRINKTKWNLANADLKLAENVPWAEDGYYVEKRPVFTLDPWLHAGAYYVQEASSMFIEQAIKRVNLEVKVQYALDLCAAPGGKSTHLLATLPEDAVLVSNEVVGSRAAILVENITKRGSANVIITQNDPTDFTRFEGLFDLMLVDAPCSGSGLFRRDPHLVSEWSPGQVVLCSQRQKRILADVLPSLKPGGFLIYSTCSYSPDENEAVLDWLAENFQMKGIGLQWVDNQYGVVVTSSPEKGIPCYRFYPGKVKGEGFFMALLQKEGNHEDYHLNVSKGKAANSSIPAILKDFILSQKDLLFHRHAEAVYAMPREVYNLFLHLKGQKMNVRKAGVKIGELIHGKFNPAHDFALADLFRKQVFPEIKLDKANALRYLRRDEFKIQIDYANGWLLVKYNELPLGFVKNLGNRINNYYPKDWRIRLAEN
jgi:16S rRNA C967 or C1407 C5-methylase (RsmB/RsmF family)/NOL1/NOP2/fmu family ribosome biogenesis protein